MSYSRTYRQRIAIPYSGYVTCPASDTPQRVPYSDVAYEDIEIDITVDTNPFDREIRGCNNTVNGLTGAIVATKTAQIAAIHESSRRVGKTIVKGFFDTVRSEISQQIMELSSRRWQTAVKRSRRRCRTTMVASHRAT